MMKRQPFTIAIHVALVIILTGALITHFCGIQGEVFLSREGVPAESFSKISGPGNGSFPFAVILEDTDIIFYPGTSTPMDFCSYLKAGDKRIKVSMNNIGEVDGWRFYQSGISSEGATLSVCHDPWGIGVTYTGYALLAIGMLGYFFQRKTIWRAMLRASRKLLVIAGITGTVFCTRAMDLPVMQASLAANFGKVHVYWNDRICPLQTMARDVTLKLYGSDTYRGMSSEQVLSGWLFYFDAWERDYNELDKKTPIGEKQKKNADECNALVRWLGTGDAFKIYPYRTAGGYTTWLSLTGRRPSQMSLEQWKFMQTTMPDIRELLLEGKNIKANDMISVLIGRQISYAGPGNLPSAEKMKAERLYNRYARPGVAAAIALALAVFYLFSGIRPSDAAFVRRATYCCGVALYMLEFYMLLIMAAIWWISGHVPMSNGPETMMFMALAALTGALCVRRNGLLRGALLLVAAMSLAVSAIGGRTPRIGALMPVLSSPLLSVHVMLVMLAYVLFVLMAVLSAVALCSKDKARQASLAVTNRVILTPAVFLLAAGIFTGAVWANCSWGRYWGWDPKETSALVMLLIYAVPLHSGMRCLSALNRPKHLHLFLLIAVLAVAFTYFGANYLLPGKHSYA